MSNLIIILLLLFIKLNNSQTDKGDNKIEPGNSQIFFLDYREDYQRNFELNIDKHSKLQINIHSINCYIQIAPIPEVEIIRSTNLNFYSLIANSSIKNLKINPLKDMVEGKPKENYDAKKCPISINSYYISGVESKLTINNNEGSVFYFTPSIHRDILHVSYNIKKKSKNNFIALHFKFEDAPFLIKITYSKNKSEPIVKKITESTFIYLDSEFLSYEGTNNDDNGNLSIDIQSESQENILMYLKIIEDETVCLLEENALNFGFITSNTTYQYYYTEVLEGEEGELFLHNKRNYGIIHSIIKDKSEINNITNLYNISLYPKGDNPEEELEYDQHYLQLKFNRSKTSKCKNGCYLLITYEQIKSEGKFPLVGYEFTILSRTWNQSDYISTIIDIPYNEYIISCFGKESSREHYYSIYVPNDTEEIKIQLEGDFFEVFYEEGRQKVNTLRRETKKFEKKDYQMVMILPLDYLDFNSTKRILSFTFKPLEYYTNIIASYYFRVLYKKLDIEDEYLPMDSNFNNLCIPQYDLEYYSCNLILKNNYYESQMNFSISSTNQNEYVKIYITGIFKNKSSLFIAEDYFNYIYVYDKNHSDIEYFKIKFEFKNNDIKSIISSFCDRVYETYPQIYSTQMFFINNFTKIYHFKPKNRLLGYYQYLAGNSGKFGDLFSADDFKGKLISLPIENGRDIDIETNTNEFTYYIQLIPSLNIVELEELKQGKPLIKFMNKTSFPLYYYYKILDQEYININVNIRFNEDNKTENYNYSIKGYIIDEDTINKKMKGEFIEIPTPYEGNYSDAYGIAFLQINQQIKGDTFPYAQYLLIELEKNDNKKEESDILLFFVEAMVKEYNISGFFLSQYIYLIDTFDDAEKQIRADNLYSIFNPKGDKIQPVIEISSQYNNTIIEFEGVNICDNATEDLTGFWRFTICENTKTTIYFKVKSSGRKTNYMIFYYLNNINDNYKIRLDVNYDKKIFDNNEKFTDISFKFNGLSVFDLEDIGLFFYISGTLYNPNEKTFELVNSTCFLYERTPAFVSAKNISIYYNEDGNKKSSEFTLIFKNVSREKNYIYDLRLQMKARLFFDFSKEEYMAFTVKADLTDIKKRDLKWLAWAIPVMVVGVTLIIVLVFLLIKFLRLRKNNTNLQQEMVSLAFSNDVQKNVLSKELQISKNESDFESTFI